MTPLSSIVLLKSLDGLMLRSDVIAQNIANANTPRYRPMRVSFEAALVEAAARGPEAVQAVRPSIVEPIGAEAGQPLRMDLELADAQATGGRYAALVELLNRQLQIDSLAVSGGR